MSKVIELRPHHALCIQHFVGKGYSEDFTSNMYRVIDDLNHSFVKLVANCDVICSVCPNCSGSKCVNESKIIRLDEATLQKSSLQIGQVLTWDEIKNTVTKSIIDKNLLLDVCHDCEWVSLCERVKK